MRHPVPARRQVDLIGQVTAASDACCTIAHRQQSRLAAVPATEEKIGCHVLEGDDDRVVLVGWRIARYLFDQKSDLGVNPC